MLQQEAASAVLESTGKEAQTKRTEVSGRLIKRAAKGGGIAFVGNVIDKGLRFPLEILLARVLGTGGYGLYSLGHGLMLIGSQISMLGLPSGIVRFAALYNGAGDTKRVKGTLTSAFVIAILTSAAAGALLFLFSGYLSTVFELPELANVLKVFALAFPFFVITRMAGNAARAFQAIGHEVAVTNICRPATNVAIVAIVFLLGFRLLGAVYGFLISSVISACFGLYLLKRIFPDIVSELKASYEIRRLVRYSLPVLFAGFSYIILGQTDRIMLGYFKASQDLGIYTAAAIISQQAGLITYSFSCIFCPIISDLYNRNEFTELGRLFKTVSRWIVSVNLLMLMLFIMFAEQIMSVFGSEFGSGGLVLVVLSAVHLIGYSAGGALVGHVLQMSGKQDCELINAIVMVTLNIALNFLLIPIHGILGAAIATGVSYAVINIARIVEVYLLLRIHAYDTNYHKPFVAGFTGVLFSMFLSMLGISRQYWIVHAAVLSTVYFVVICLLGLEQEDKMIWEAIKRKINN